MTKIPKRLQDRCLKGPGQGPRAPWACPALVSLTKVGISSRLGVRAQVLQRHSDWNKVPAHPFTHHSPLKLLGMHFDPSDPKLTFNQIGLQPASPPPPVHSGQTCLIIAHPASHPIPSTPRFPSIPLDSS
ncbi:hypothetical protein CROQUDRAFT_99272 [Cronartium quercuum f. sp. fusiforme G11]|uniref:Uncharacterized protein n=1 Tax=Cronartium quercuum f. sp. fusiforme G11 TaxID=708437 RepID=A0A9P6T6I1_9BASI|nr:hypothetical protein CROQUDRAFT_99272 [Cronartium quercuum f. sp. fusiforme G11]